MHQMENLCGAVEDKQEQLRLVQFWPNHFSLLVKSRIQQTINGVVCIIYTPVSLLYDTKMDREDREVVQEDANI